MTRDWDMLSGFSKVCMDRLKPVSDDGKKLTARGCSATDGDK